MCCRKISLLLLGGLLLDQSISSDLAIQTLPSGCNDLKDGIHFIQPTSQQDLADYDAVASPIKVYCSNGYAVIDPNLDGGVLNYFSSFHKYVSSYAGPDLYDRVTWKEWWLPSRLDSEMLWSVSKDCQTCLDTNTLEYGSNTAYYMTPDSFGCNSLTRNMCDFDPVTLECSICSGISSGDPTQYGKCGHVPLAANTSVDELHETCTEASQASMIPSIGTTSQYCVCFKPSTVQNITCDLSLIDTAISSKALKNADVGLLEKDLKRIVYLYQSDFLNGTYRITEPGLYIIAEDIEFDFNTGDLNNPNAEGAWFPHSDQVDEYPGANQYDGWYWLGFFAGITIESNNVVLDLNQHEIKMSPAFFFQQRWFICIEISNKAFLDGQGPSWSGTDMKSVFAATIKNGIIGLSSHMGIHGSNVTNVVIENIQVRHFETHGIAFNEYTNLQIKNVEIGPSVRGHIGLNGNYALARISLYSIRGAASEADSSTIKFTGRDEEYTLQDLVDRLVRRMDLAFRWAYFGIEGEGKEWDEAYSLFVHESGNIFGGTLYGLVLRSRGAAVFNFDASMGYNSIDGYLENVTIHDLVIDTIEYIATATSTSILWARDPINGPITFEFATDNNLNPVDESIYVGNAWTDVMIGMRKLSNAWQYLDRLALDEYLLEWAQTGVKLGEISPSVMSMCNYDTLGHVPKGIVGIKIEGTINLNFKNLVIKNLINVGALGSSKCGEYMDGTDGGMPLQNPVYNAGFGASPVRSIAIFNSSGLSFEDVKISNIFSAQSFVYGIYVGSKVKNLTLKSISFEHLSAGVLNDEDYSTDHLPNMAAATCAIEDQSAIYTSYSDVTAKCLYGHTYCNVKYCPYNEGTCFGKIDECDVLTTYELPTSTVTISKDLEVSIKEEINYAFEPVVTSSLFTSINSVQRSQISSSKYYYYVGVIILIAIIIFMGFCIYSHSKIKSQISNCSDPLSQYIVIQ